MFFVDPLGKVRNRAQHSSAATPTNFTVFPHAPLSFMVSILLNPIFVHYRQGKLLPKMDHHKVKVPLPNLERITTAGKHTFDLLGEGASMRHAASITTKMEITTPKVATQLYRIR
jgi:hypothetical protein